MERLTKRKLKGNGYYMKCSETCPHDCQETCDCEEFDKFVDLLASYEKTGLEPQEIERIVDTYGRELSLRTESARRLEMIREIPDDRLWEIAEAERNGRIKIIRKPDLGTCGSCRHFRRIGGRAVGHCKEQPYCKDKHGTVYVNRAFTTTQSRKACKQYIPAAEPMEG